VCYCVVCVVFVSECVVCVWCVCVCVSECVCVCVGVCVGGLWVCVRARERVCV